MMAREKAVDLAAYVVGCTAAAAIAYFLAGAVGLQHPLWACIFALIASQGSLETALPAMAGRVIGTIIGVVVAIVVNEATRRLALDMATQMLIDVAICAVFAWGRPAIVVCLWTPPIILISAAPGESIAAVGFARGCEVVVGVIVGGLVHMAAEKVSALARARG
jgi:uncharacterized membrane protein YgaE (UPF0421/DUF939 family)